MLGSGQQNLNVANGLNAIDGIVRQTAGNKDAIKRLIQTGVISEMQGVLAGMRADEISKAGMLGKGNMPTVAQQVLSPQPPQGMTSPAPPQMGVPSVPPPMPPHTPQDMQPQPGMASGGIASLPVPNDMFNSAVGDSDTQAYAPGGPVAFSNGGMTDKEYLDYIRRKESHGRDYDKNGKPLRSRAGAMYAMQVLPSTARDPGYGVNPISAETPEEYNRVGSDLALALRKKYGDVGGAMAYNWGPGNYQKWRDAGSPAEGIPSETRNYISELGGLNAAAAMPERNMDSAAGRAGSLEDLMGMMGSINKKSDEEIAATDKYRAILTERASDEEYEKQRKEDMWATLAQIGFNMASSKSPYVLQAIGEAAAAALPEAKADKKYRKETRDRAIEGLMELGARDRKEATESFKAVVPLWQEGIRAEQFQKEYGLKERQVANEREYQQGMVAAADYKAKHPNMSDLEAKVAWVLEEGHAKDRLGALKYLKDNGLHNFGGIQSGAVDANMDGIPDAMSGGGGGQAPDPLGIR